MWCTRGGCGRGKTVGGHACIPRTRPRTQSLGDQEGGTIGQTREGPARVGRVPPATGGWASRTGTCPGRGGQQVVETVHAHVRGRAACGCWPWGHPGYQTVPSTSQGGASQPGPLGLRVDGSLSGAVLCVTGCAEHSGLYRGWWWHPVPSCQRQRCLRTWLSDLWGRICPSSNLPSGHSPSPASGPGLCWGLSLIGQGHIGH